MEPQQGEPIRRPLGTIVACKAVFGCLGSLEEAPRERSNATQAIYDGATS